MQSYLFKLTFTFLTLLMLHVIILLSLPAPFAAEYWVHELIVMKRSMLAALPSPRIVLMGGSSVLFGYDAKKIKSELGIPTFNFGVHGGVRLDRLLSWGQEVARPGDIFVLALEEPFYNCNQSSWSPWQVRNALAWDRDYFNSFPILDRILAVSSAGVASLAFETIFSYVEVTFISDSFEKRVRSIEPDEAIVSRIRAGMPKAKTFEYSAENIDDRGDIQRD